MEKHYCILPWIHLYIGPNGSVNPCCTTTDIYSTGSIRKDTLEDLWNSERMKNIRLQMLEGKIPDACKVCSKMEEHGFKSDRMKAAEHFPDLSHLTEETNSDGSLDKFELKYLDVRFSNHCNLSCRICRPNSSTGWYQDAKFLGLDHMDLTKTIMPTPGNKKLMEEILPQLEYVEKLFFAGGEPLMQTEHYRLLEKLIDMGKTDVVLSYVTNFSSLEYLKWDVLKLWSHFKTVNVSASLDGAHDKGEYLRKGISWKKIEENIRKVQKFSGNINFALFTTISIHNVFHMFDFLEYMVLEQNVQGRNIEVSILTDPTYYSVQTLPVEKKEEVLLAAKVFIEKHQDKKDDQDWQSLFKSIDSVISYMMEKDHSPRFANFISMTKRLDFIRNESFAEIFPEFREYW